MSRDVEASKSGQNFGLGLGLAVFGVGLGHGL